MQPKLNHAWQLTSAQAVQLQKRLRQKLIVSDQFDKVTHVAGVDVGFTRNGEITRAAVAVLSFPELTLVDSAVSLTSTTFPYIPGLLSFREIPAILDALDRLRVLPDLVLCDGQGIAHPRGLGIASHLGLLIDRPTIGCAKSRLVGEFSQVGEKKGSYAPLLYKERVVGAVVRTKRRVRPLFISPGNGISLDGSVKMVLDCCGSYRMPEPSRQAHLLVSTLRRRQEVG